MRRSPESGVTLIEVMIAVSLVGLVSAGILTALRVGVSAMEKSNRLLEANRRVIGVQRIIEQQVAGLMPVFTFCRPAPDDPPQRRLFFQGEPASMRFVSSYSLEEAARGYARILEFQVIPGANHRGVRLVVNERLYTGPDATGAICRAPIVAGPRSFVLADRLAYCRFRYQEAPLPPRPRQWVEVWVEQTPPVAVRIEMAPLEPDPSRLQVGTMTLPIRASRTPGVAYED